MRVLFLTLYPDTAASPRYRVTQFLPYLRAHGVECTVCPPMAEAAWRRLYGAGTRRAAAAYHLRELWGRAAQLLRARRYDVVLVQKSLMSACVRGMPALLDRIDAPLVYDIDDAVHLAPPHPLGRPWRLLEDRDQVRRVAARADLVLAGNPWLAAELSGLGSPVVVFPTVVDTDRFTPPTAPPEPFRVGWIGTPSTTPSLVPLAPVLSGRGDATVLLVGADPRKVDWAGVRCVPWRHDREVEEVRGFSVGIMPLPRDTWTLGKCALKALLYGACAVPCVATPHGAVRDILRDGQTGFFADAPADWAVALERLRDPALRRRVGEAARAVVERDYSLRTAAPRLLALLEGLR